MPKRTERRDFLKTTATASAAVACGVWSQCGVAASRSPNDKIHLAAIGVTGMGGTDLRELAKLDGVVVAALCDVDEERLERAAKLHPKAKKYVDFRQMLEQEQKNIDIVSVGTPDHIHAPASLMAMKMGKHCYCQKPLAHNVVEVRSMAKLAAEKKLVTQMGTQMHATERFHQAVEIIQSGAIGPVHEVVAWFHHPWPFGTKRLQGDFSVPKNLNWDLWLGPALPRPYAPDSYHPAHWRRWWDFGAGLLGDMGCHLFDLSFWALGLRHPLTVEAAGPAVDPERSPDGLTVHWEFPPTDGRPAVKLTWHDGDRVPATIGGHAVPKMGVMFLGKDGQFFIDYQGYKLYPEDKFKGYQAPARTIPRSIGHWAEWVKGCREGTATASNFEYASRLAETVLLGNVAYRSGKKLEWDAAACKAVNCPEADRFLRREYRKGWEL
jgi:predicted dehydrogenase